VETDVHRQLAKQTYGDTWALLDAERTPAQDLELVTRAFTSRYHWGLAGGVQEAVVSDWMVSRCLAAVGDGQLSLRFAEAAADGLPEGHPAWLAASVEEGLARAHAALGDALRREQHLTKARQILATEPDPEDREIIGAQLDDVPPA
jgi:hypothetical protein